MSAPDHAAEPISQQTPVTWLGRVARESFGLIGVGILVGSVLFFLAALAPTGDGSATGFVVFALALMTSVPATMLGGVWLLVGVVATPPRYRRAEVSGSSWIGVRLVQLTAAAVIVCIAATVAAMTWAGPILMPPIMLALMLHGAIAWWIVARSARSLQHRLPQHPIAEMFTHKRERKPGSL